MRLLARKYVLASGVCLCVSTLVLHCLFFLTGSALISQSIGGVAAEEGHDSAKNCELVTVRMCNQMHRKHFLLLLIYRDLRTPIKETQSQQNYKILYIDKVRKKQIYLLFYLHNRPHSHAI